MTIHLRLILLLATFVYTHGLMVLAPVNECNIKKGEVRLAVNDKRDCLKMGGIFKGKYIDNVDHMSFGPYILIKTKYLCIVDICEVPYEGAVSNGAVWTIRRGGREPCRGLDDPTQAAAIIPMASKGCDALVGEHITKWLQIFSPNDVMCEICMNRMKGTDKNYVDGVAFCAKNRCNQKLADIYPVIGQRECLFLGGKVSHESDFAKELSDQCSLDVGLSLNCTPRDFWSEIQTCTNVNSTKDLTCSYEKRIGTEVGSSEESSTGGSVSSTITTEVGAELKNIFTAKVTASFTTGFNWQKTTTSSKMWSQSSSQTLTVTVPPGETVTVSQVIGVCDEFEVRTTEFRVISTPANSLAPQSFYINKWLISWNLILLCIVVHLFGFDKFLII